MGVDAVKVVTLPTEVSSLRAILPSVETIVNEAEMDKAFNVIAPLAVIETEPVTAKAEVSIKSTEFAR